MAHEVAHVCSRVGRDVEQLALDHPGPRIAGDVPDGVAAALAGGQPGLAELADQLRGVGQRDVMHLDVLPRRDVPLAQRHVFLDHLGERVELIRGDAPERELDADHLHGRLALSVHALPEAELDEVGLLDTATEEARRLRVEVVELALQDGNDVAGDVVDHFRGLEGAGATRRSAGDCAFKRCWLHRAPSCRSGRQVQNTMYQKAIGLSLWCSGVEGQAARCGGQRAGAGAGAG